MAQGERSFHFEPVKPKKGKPKNMFTPYITISKMGLICFGSKTLTALGMDKKCSIKLYQDLSKRTIAWKIVNEIGKKEDGYRFFVPKNYTGTNIGYLSVLTIINELKDVKLPSLRIPVKKYTDNDPMMNIGEVFYVKIPYGEDNPWPRKFNSIDEE